jgi:hypothetical protein
VALAELIAPGGYRLLLPPLAEICDRWETGTLEIAAGHV